MDADRIAQVTETADGRNVAMYIIGLGPHLSPKIERLAYRSGGAALEVGSLEIVPKIDQMVAELRGAVRPSCRAVADGT